VCILNRNEGGSVQEVLRLSAQQNGTTSFIL
jgi:hypothetical protein